MIEEIRQQGIRRKGRREGNEEEFTPLLITFRA